MSNQTVYLSFCGEFLVPENVEQLRVKYPMCWHVNGDDKEVDDHYIVGFQYEHIDSRDSLCVSMAIVEDGIGHIVADCSAAGWIESSFVLIDNNNNPIRPETNFNPNPVRQLVSNEQYRALALGKHTASV